MNWNPHISAWWLLLAFGVGLAVGPYAWYRFRRWFCGD